MNRTHHGWLLPVALSGYMAVAAFGEHQGSARWLLLGVPALIWFAHRRLGPRQEPEPDLRVRRAFELTLLAVGVFLPALLGPDDHPLFQAGMAVGQASALSAALFLIARVEAPRGLVQPHPSTASLDALLLGLVLWSVTLVVALSRAFFPGIVSVDPPTIDTAFLFSSLGSLLLLTAALLRLRLLRGVELGVGDRARSALSLALAGTLIGAGSGLIRTGTADLVASVTVVLTSLFVTWCLAAPSASRVNELVRGSLAVLLLGAPVALFGAHLAMTVREHPAAIALGLAALSIVVGIVARQVARPLGPEGSRWLTAMTAAMDRALQPRPDLGLRGALAELKKCELSPDAKPELFRSDPESLLSIDVAGYLSEKEAEFPLGVYELALAEPGKTLRHEALVHAQVKRPKVRPQLAWMEAHRAKSATALFDDDGPVGLLVLNRGARTAPLSSEEVDRLEALAARLTGLLSVTSSLARAHRGQMLSTQKATVASDMSRDLERKLQDQTGAGEREAQLLTEALYPAAHGSAATAALDALRGNEPGALIGLLTPPGIDPRPWAAHTHLTQLIPGKAFIVVDATATSPREAEFWQAESVASPLARAAAGTLVIVAADTLAPPLLDDVIQRAKASGTTLILSCRSAPNVSGRPMDVIQLPSLADRTDDLHALILLELSRISLATRGHALGISRPALADLIERPYLGGDAELRGLLSAAVAHARGELVLPADISAADSRQETGAPPSVAPAFEARVRARPSPRSRRPKS